MSSEEKDPTWIHTERAELHSPFSNDGEWPEHNLAASINPRISYVEVTASLKHHGVMIRMSKEDFVKWLDECQELLKKQASNPGDTIPRRK